MTSTTLRRRLHHGDLDGKKHEHVHSTGSGSASGSDSLNEPLLAAGAYQSDDDIGADNERKKERVHWTFLFSQLVAQWAHWLANVVLGSGSFLKRLLPRPSPNQNGLTYTFSLTPLQEERLKNLQQRLQVPFDPNHVEHQDALKHLWRLAYPDRELPPLKSDLWKEMGWQGSDPSTDFRGGGFVSLENLIYFAKTHPEPFQRLLHKKDGERSDWEYPFAVAGINISFMLVQMLDLHSGKPNSVAGVRFLEFLSEDEMAFDNLFCVAFEMMDAQWLAKRASYMQFNEVMKSTRTQLERELALEDVSNVRDLPMYNLLSR